MLSHIWLTEYPCYLIWLCSEGRSLQARYIQTDRIPLGLNHDKVHNEMTTYKEPKRDPWAGTVASQHDSDT